jgi:hypothetical protein
MPAFFAAVPIGDNLLFPLNAHPQKVKNEKPLHRKSLILRIVRDFSKSIMLWPEVSLQSRSNFFTGQKLEFGK